MKFDENGNWDPSPAVKKLIISSLIFMTFLTIYLFVTNENQKSQVIGTYTSIMRGKPINFQTLTLKKDGTGYFKNTEFEKQVGPEFCTFDYSVKSKKYIIKEGSYEYISITNMQGNSTLCQIINGVPKIINKGNNNIELKFMLTNEETQNNYYFRKN